IVEYIEQHSNSSFQIKAPEGAVEYLLHTGRALVIFDGLDELLDTSRRRKITEDIESFATRYANASILVTSREIGYDQAPLNRDVFDQHWLAPFTPPQVQQYIRNWFATDYDLSSEQQKTKAQNLIRESESVSDLRTNPLMLGLMCTIYRGENYIPKNRPDVYEKCATMLFERWDRSRGIEAMLPFEQQVRPAMMFLANWIYSDTRLQSGVTEDQLIKKASDYLLQRRFERSDEALGAAKSFVDFCVGRAWVFTDTGTTAAGDNIFQFTHRTFLEYFTAGYLVRRSS